MSCFYNNWRTHKAHLRATSIIYGIWTCEINFANEVRLHSINCVIVYIHKYNVFCTTLFYIFLTLHFNWIDINVTLRYFNSHKLSILIEYIQRTSSFPRNPCCFTSKLLINFLGIWKGRIIFRFIVGYTDIKISSKFSWISTNGLMVKLVQISWVACALEPDSWKIDCFWGTKNPEIHEISLLHQTLSFQSTFGP